MTSKSGLPKLLTQLAILFAALTLVSGCATTQIRQSTAASKALTSASEDVRLETQRLETTMASLQALVNQPEGDLRGPYKRFSKDLQRLKDAAARSVRTGEDLAVRSHIYLASWQTTLEAITFEHVRERSEARRQEVNNQLARVQQRYDEVQSVVDPMINYLQDIRTALAADLTGEGLRNVKSLVANASSNAMKVQTALANLQSDLLVLGEKLAPVLIASESPPATAQ